MTTLRAGPHRGGVARSVRSLSAHSVGNGHAERWAYGSEDAIRFDPGDAAAGGGVWAGGVRHERERRVRSGNCDRGDDDRAPPPAPPEGADDRESPPPPPQSAERDAPLCPPRSSRPATPRPAPRARPAPRRAATTRRVARRPTARVGCASRPSKDLQSDENGLFKQLVSQNEIIIYNGHSFYGSLNVLNDLSIYPGRYQIFLMSSCWSYEDYTKQILLHNQTEADPLGWLRADVVNDTQMGWFHNMPAVARILLTNVFRGAETGGVEGDRYYTWDRIIGAMNDYALKAQQERGTDTHEIFDVSGVRTNVYQPAE
jgi:hypothetical protein